MRPLEIALTAILFPYILFLLSASRGQVAWLSLLPFLALVLTLGHFVMEGQRWQMYPIYALAFLLAAYECARWFVEFRPSYVATLAALACLTAGIFFSTVLPVFSLPDLSGPHQVGTQTRLIVDHSRRDPFAEDRNQPRELVVQLWYPADMPTAARRAPYRDAMAATLWNGRYTLVETHSLSDAPLSRWSERYPVVLYAPSWHGLRTESTFRLEELASYGYIVVGIDHPYSSLVTVFPDGRVARTKLKVTETYRSQEAFEEFLAAADEQVTLRAEDARSVLDALERLNVEDASGLLAGHLDLDHIGIFGFSLGGSVAAQACWLDRRFKAGADLDGLIAGKSAIEGTVAPFLFVTEDDPRRKPVEAANTDPAARRQHQYDLDQLALMLRSLQEWGGYWVALPGTEHSNFSDAPFFSPLRALTHVGAVDGEKTARTINQYVLAFFDQHLRDGNPTLLDRAWTGSAEVQFQLWRGDNAAKSQRILPK